jgi:hypothetical protein
VTWLQLRGSFKNMANLSKLRDALAERSAFLYGQHYAPDVRVVTTIHRECSFR